MMKTPMQQGQQCQKNEGKDASKILATKPAQLGWIRQYNKGNNASTKEEDNSTKWVNTPVQYWQQGGCNKGNNISAMRANTPT